MINLSVPDLEVKVGDLDVTAYCTNLTLRYPRAQPQQAFIAEGELRLQHKLHTPIATEFDPLLHPSRWERGQQPVTITIRGTLFATLRIASYFYDDEHGIGTADLTDLLGLVNSYQPPNPVQGMKPGRAIFPGKAALLALQQAGKIDGTQYLPAIATPANLGSEPYKTPLLKFNGSFVQFSQTILGERGWWWWCDRNETIRPIRYNPNAAPLYQLPRSALLLYEAQRNDPAPSKVLVTGVPEKLSPCNHGAVTVTEIYETIEGRRRLIQRITRNRQPGSVPEIRPNISSTVPGKIQFMCTTTEAIDPNSTSGSLIPISRRWDKWVWRDDGYAEAHGWLEEQPLKAIAPQISAISSRLVVAEDGLERWNYRLDDTVESYTTNLQQPEYRLYAELGATRDKLGLVSDETISWIDDRPGSDPRPPCNGYTQQVTRTIPYWTILRRIADAGDAVNYEGHEFLLGSLVDSFGYAIPQITKPVLDPDVPRPQPNQNPPTPPSKEPDYPLEQVVIKGEAMRQIPGTNPFAPATLEVQADSLLNDGEARAYADLLLEIEQGRSRSRLIAHALTPEVLANWQPFYVSHCHKAAWICDSPSLVIEGGRCAWSFNANYVGSIAPVPEPTYPLWLPSDELSIVLANQTIRVGFAIRPINLQAAGGTPPYSYSLLSALPAGLSLTAGVISGIPTTAGIITTEIEVEDALADTATATITWTVEAQPIPLPPVQKIYDLCLSYAHTLTAAIAEPQLVVSATISYSHRIFVTVVPYPTPPANLVYDFTDPLHPITQTLLGY